MRSLLLHTFISIYVLTATVHVGGAVASETVVGVAGRKVTLPCRLETANQKGVDVCWGRGQPSLFTCHNAVINAAGDQVSYRKSDRYSVSSSSLNIFNTRLSDAGFYHCRVQLPGLFNDQTSTVHLIVINPRPVVSEPSSEESSELSDNQDAPHTTASYSQRDTTQETGSDVDTTGPVVAPVQSPVQQQQQQQGDSLQIYIGSTVRLSFIIFIPAVVLTAGYRVWRRNQRSDSDRRTNESEEENSSV